MGVQCATGAIPPLFPPAPLSPPNHVHPVVPQPTVVGAGLSQPAITGAPVNVPLPSQQAIVGSAVPQPALVGQATAGIFPAQPAGLGPQVPFNQPNIPVGPLPDNVRTGFKDIKDDSVNF